LIPKVKAYLDTNTSAHRSRFEVEEMLEKKFKINQFAWKRDDPENSYLLFKYKSEHLNIPLVIKVGIPFIERSKRAEPRNRFSEKVDVYDENRSYRFLFHILKAMLLNTEIGMGFEQTFSNYLVVGELPDHTPVNVQDKIIEQIATGKAPALEVKPDD